MVMLAPVEEPNAETEEWIWDTGAALDVASAAVAGRRKVSSPLRFCVQVVNEAEAAAVEVEAVDFPEVNADGKDETTLRDAVAEEVLVPAVGALSTGGVLIASHRARVGCAL